MEINASEICFDLCGNMYVGTYSVQVSLSRPYGWLQYEASLTPSYKSGESNAHLDAVIKLHKNLERKFPSFDPFGGYINTTIPKEIYNKLWLDSFRKIRIGYIRFGYDLSY